MALSAMSSKAMSTSPSGSGAARQPFSLYLAGARVGLATIALGDDGALIDAIAEHVDGLVVAAFGVGHVPAAVTTLLASLPSASRSSWRHGPALAQSIESHTAFPGRNGTFWPAASSARATWTRSRPASCCIC